MDGNVKNETDDRYVFQALTTIKNHGLKLKKPKLVIPAMQDTGGIQFTRIVKYLFYNTVVEITQFKTSADQETKNQTESGSDIQRTNRKNTKADEDTRSKARKLDDAVIVSMKEKTYADIETTNKTK